MLVLNSGSTSMKIALYREEAEVFSATENYDHQDLDRCGSINGQFDLRMDSVRKVMEEHGCSMADLSVIVSRGGSTKPLAHGGAYTINEKMAHDLRECPASSHAGNLGPMIAWELSRENGIPAYIYDSVAVDELQPVARISGLPDISRVSLVHVLNSRYAARKVAREQGVDYEKSTYIVAHIGGGITITLHHNGKIIDVVGDDEGPFSPDRGGGIPTRQLVDLCYSGKYPTREDMQRAMRTQGGLTAYLQTTDARKVEERIAQGDEKAKLVYDAMLYQIAKGIAQLAAPVCGKVDGVILTGGIAHSQYAMDEIKRQVSFLAPVWVIPGEHEMQSLCQGALAVLRGKEVPHTYE